MSDGTVKSMRVSANPMAANDGASLWDLGGGVACFEVHTKMNALNVQALEILEHALATAGSGFGALVLGNDDARAFSAGADLAYNHAMVSRADWPALATYFKKGQDLYQTLAASPVPVIAAVHGFALGGGCEMMLHSHAVVAHAGLRAGLPEIKVGLIPAWGGCTQLLLRCAERLGPEAGLARALAVLQAGEIAASAAQAQAMGLLRPGTMVVADRVDLLPAAVAKARAMMVEGFTPPAEPTLTYCGEPAHAKHLRLLEAAVADGSLGPDAAVVMREAIGVLTGYPGVVEKSTHPITVSQAAELASADRLIRTPAALAAIIKLIGG
ncbi:MAG: enoyl-CoA hydratase/isomerase family protein [Sphingomonas sp.]